MPDTHTVPVTLDVTPDVAAALNDPATRERVARLVSRAVRPGGLTDHPAEAGRAAAAALVAEFREVRRGQTLGGIPIRELIEEGRR